VCQGWHLEPNDVLAAMDEVDVLAGAKLGNRNRCQPWLSSSSWLLAVYSCMSCLAVVNRKWMC
jgi:hypothetical protein